MKNDSKNKQEITQTKNTNTKETIMRLLGHMGKSSYMLLIVFILAIVGTIMQVISPKKLGNATTLLYTSIRNGTALNMAEFSQILITVALLYVGVAVGLFLQERIMTTVSQNTAHNLRSALKTKMNQLPISYYDENSTGNLMSIANNDMDNIASTLQESLTKFVSNMILLVGVFWMMLTISPLLTLIVLIMVPASILIMKFFMPLAKKNQRLYLQTQGELNGLVEETIQGHEVIKNFSGEKTIQEDFHDLNQKMYDSGWKSKFFGGSAMPAMMVVKNINYVIIAAVCAVKVAAGSITIGDMQAFLQYSSQFTTPISHFTHVWNNIISAVSSAERVFQILDSPEIEEQEPFTKKHEENEKVVFENVRFSYDQEEFIEDLSFKVKEGTKTAIVGKTGSGKTTLINLLEGFYPVKSGSIRIDGVDIKELGTNELRKQMGMVLQDTWLFGGTIYDNIRYGNMDATEAEVYAAAEAANVDEFVRRLPMGYNTILSEEADNISGGQKQLITIARAFVSNPDIIILDEATSNVDSRTEVSIQLAMKELLKGRTSFVIAHRLSTIYDADNILVMDSGSIVEMGNHKELLEYKGEYSEIYESQFAPVSA